MHETCISWTNHIIVSRKSKGAMNKKTGNVQSRVRKGKIRTREKQWNVQNGAEKSKRRKVREAF